MSEERQEYTYGGKARDRRPLAGGLGRPQAETPAPSYPHSKGHPAIAPQWMGVREAILRDPTNTDRLRRIAGSLGRLAGEVRFGLEGPTMQEVGKVLGTEEASWPR